MKNKRENGEVVVEASIIVTLVFIVISIMFYIGMVLYQQTAISTVANRTATNISQVYSNTLRDPFTGYVDPDNAYQSITYSNMKTDAYLDAIKQKGTAFAQYRLKKSQIIPAVDREVDVQVVNKPNEILKGQIVVTITDTYDVPLVGMFGLDSELTFTATGRADCVDYLEYLLGVEAIADPEHSSIPSLPDSDTCIVTFVKDKYSGGFHAAVPVLRGKTIITSNNHSHSTMPENPELNGMKFTGWVTDDGRNFSASIQVDENMTVYGTWDCDITFDPTGGTVNPKKMTVRYKKTTTLPEPSKYSFRFLGWYSDVEYSEEYKSNNGTGTQYISGVTEIPGNITLYAKWECTHEEFTHTEIDSGNCSTKSTWRHDCKTCNYSYIDRGDWGECEAGGKAITVSPTCTKTGIYVLKCKYCNKTIIDDNGNAVGGVEPALGHCYASGNSGPFDTPIDDKPTCEEDGYKGSKCSRCKTIQGNKVNKLGHDWNSGTVTKSSTCYSTGIKTYKCKRNGCNATYNEDIAKIAHSYDNSPIVTISATCQRKEQGYYPCKNASKGCTAQKPYTGDKVGHSFNGRCGETHTLRDKLSSSNNGCAKNNLKKFQCIVCEWCGEYQKATKGEYNQIRILSNGQKMTIKGKKWCVTCLEEVWPTENPEWVEDFWNMPVQKPKENGEIDTSHPKGN